MGTSLRNKLFLKESSPNFASIFSEFKGTLMQIWKCAKHVEDFALKHLLRFKIYLPETCEKFVYRHSETIE